MATTDGALGARNTDYAQALALAGLLVGASLSLSRLYASNGWVLATWLTIGSALGLAALLRRMGVGQLLSLLAMLAVPASAIAEIALQPVVPLSLFAALAIATLHELRERVGHANAS